LPAVEGDETSSPSVVLSVARADVSGIWPHASRPCWGLSRSTVAPWLLGLPITWL